MFCMRVLAVHYHLCMLWFLCQHGCSSFSRSTYAAQDGRPGFQMAGGSDQHQPGTEPCGEQWLGPTADHINGEGCHLIMHAL